MARGVLVSRLPTQLVNASSSIQISAGASNKEPEELVSYRHLFTQQTKWSLLRWKAGLLEKSDGRRRPLLIQPTHQRLGFPAVWVGSGVGIGASGAQKRPHGPAGTISYSPASDANHIHLMCYASDTSLPSLWEMVKMSNRFSVYAFTIFLVFTRI